MGKFITPLWFYLSLLIICTAVSALSEPPTIAYPEAGIQASIIAPMEVEAGGNATFTLVFSSKRRLDVVVRVSYLYGKGNITSWREIYRGPLTPAKNVEVNCTFKVPENAETGPLVMWIYLEFLSDEDRETVSGKSYYADWSFITAGPYVVSKEDSETKKKAEILAREVKNLRREKSLLRQTVEELLYALDNVTQQLEIVKRKEAEANFAQRNLEAQYNNTLKELTKIKNELQLAKAENEELARLNAALGRQNTALTAAVIAAASAAAILAVKYHGVRGKCGD